MGGGIAERCLLMGVRVENACADHRRACACDCKRTAGKYSTFGGHGPATAYNDSDAAKRDRVDTHETIQAREPSVKVAQAECSAVY